MQRALLVLAVCFSLPLAAAATVSVTVTSPGNGSQVGSPFTLTASASSHYAIVGWHVYVDSNDVYSGGATNHISPSINASAGRHQVVIRAWDSSGAYGSVTEEITVTSGGGGGGNGLPDPPPGAIVFNNIDDMSGWNWCNASSCSGGSGNGTYWMAQHQNPPSRDGSSTEFYNSGVWENGLWFKKLGANDNVHNFLWDFYFQVDDASLNNAQALEFDVFQFVHGYNYMIGTECNYDGGAVWDTWNEVTGHWIHTGIPCHKFSANTWHHIQWYMTTNTNNHTYTYVTLVVDGNSTPVNITQPTKNIGWSDNLGAQFQMDDTAGGGSWHEWIDSEKLTVW